MRSLLWSGVDRVQSSLSMADWIWRIFSVFSVGGSAVVAGALAKIDPLLSQLGWIYWLFIALLAGLVVSIILLLFKVALSKSALSKYYESLAVPRSQINPMLDHFNDLIIPVEDLRLPIQQLHSRKFFRRCKFVGPATLMISGGSYTGNGFADIGDIIALPDNTTLVGVVSLDDCVVDSCEFVRVTILADQMTASAFARMGASVKGLNPTSPPVR